MNDVTKTALRKAVGRGKFTVADLAEAFEVTAPTARKHITRLAEAGKVEHVGKTETGKRGRPADQYKVASGK